MVGLKNSFQKRLFRQLLDISDKWFTHISYKIINSHQRKQEGEIDCRGKPVCSGTRVAAVVTVDVAGSLSAEPVEQAEDVAHQNQQHQTRHAQTDVISGTEDWRKKIELNPLRLFMERFTHSLIKSLMRSYYLRNLIVSTPNNPKKTFSYQRNVKRTKKSNSL